MCSDVSYLNLEWIMAMFSICHLKGQRLSIKITFIFNTGPSFQTGSTTLHNNIWGWLGEEKPHQLHQAVLQISSYTKFLNTL